jgi:hypothetical protein
VGTPAHGSATNTSTSVTYTPTKNFVGTDGPFSYGIVDSSGAMASSTITVTVSVALTASIGPGVAASGPSATETFGVNSCTGSGGSGSYTYVWSPSGGGVGGTWTSGATAGFAPSVSNVPNGGFSSASYSCTVTDTTYHVSAKSNSLTYSWRNTLPPN